MPAEEKRQQGRSFLWLQVRLPHILASATRDKNGGQSNHLSRHPVLARVTIAWKSVLHAIPPSLIQPPAHCRPDRRKQELEATEPHNYLFLAWLHHSGARRACPKTLQLARQRQRRRFFVTMVLAPLPDVLVDLTRARPRFPAGSAPSEPLLSAKSKTSWPSPDAVAELTFFLPPVRGRLFLFSAGAASKTAASWSSMISVSELFFDPAPADAPARAKRCRLRNHLPIARDSTNLLRLPGAFCFRPTQYLSRAGTEPRTPTVSTAPTSYPHHHLLIRPCWRDS